MKKSKIKKTMFSKKDALRLKDILLTAIINEITK